jgi:hypothetical protein
MLISKNIQIVLNHFLHIFNLTRLFLFGMNAKRILFLVGIILGLVFPIYAQAATTLTVEPSTWNVVGLDSNNVNVGANRFPVGARICNTGSEIANNVTATLVWNSSNSYIDLRAGTASTLPASGTVNLAIGACIDAFFEVEVARNTAAYDTTRLYHIDISATNAPPVSTPPSRELYVEHLVSQSRNTTTDMQLSNDGTNFTSIGAGGTMTLMVGNTYWIKFVGSTATNGYEQIESFINFPNIIFQLLSVVTTYSAETSANMTPPYNHVYGDACTWENDPNSPNYRSCLSTGKAGGNITVTFQVKILSIPSAPLANPEPLSMMVYDFSGSSYHYNADYGASVRFANIVNASLTKSFSPKLITPSGTSTLTFTITNPGSESLTNVNFVDNFPSGVSVAGTPGLTYTNCGASPSPSSVSSGATSISFSNIEVAGLGTCTIAVNVTASTAGTYNNTTNNLFINSTIDTLSQGSDSLVVSSNPGPPSSCTTPTTMVTWNFGTVAAPTLTPVINVPDVTLATASGAAASPGTIGTDTADGNAASSYRATNWATTGTITPPNPPSPLTYFQFDIDTSNYGNVTITFDYHMLPGDWANVGNNFLYIYTDTSASGAPSWASGTGYAASKGAAWTIGQTHTAATTGTTQTRFFISAAGAKSSTKPLNIDNVVIRGCPRPTPPTLSKAFSPTSIAQGSASTLTFTFTNPNTTSLTGVNFSDTLPTGLVVNTPNGLSSPTCTTGSISGQTITATEGGTSISMSGATLAANSSCSFSVSVKGNVAGTYNNVSTNIRSAETLAGSAGTATLTVVAPPVISKSFGSTFILTGNTTSLRFSITNPNLATTLTGVAFTDTLPPGLIVASPNGLSGSCGGGTITATSGSGTVSLSGASLTAGASCTFFLNVQGTTTGNKNNSVTVTSTNGGTGNTASASVLVRDPAANISILKQVGASASESGSWFNNLAIASGNSVYYKFTVENIGDFALTSVNVTDPTLTGLGVSLAGCAWANMPLFDVQTCVVGPVTAVYGSHPNTATAHGTYITEYTDTDTATYATTGLTIVKSVAELNFTAAGDVLHYSYRVTNTGFESLVGPVTVTDDKIASVTCPPVTTVGDLDNFLDPGSLTGTVEVTNGSATVTGTGTNFTGELAVGRIISINLVHYAVKSIESDTSLTLTTAYDDTSASGLTIPYGESIICTGTYTVTAADVTATFVANTAHATANGVQSNDDFMTVTTNPTLVFLTDFRAYEEAGQVVVRWETAYEHNTLGFNLFRLDPVTGEYRAVNSGLLPGILAPHRSGIYSFIDRDASPGKTYTYKLIEVELNGRQLSYGPFIVFVGKNTIDEGLGISLSSGYNRKKSTLDYSREKKSDSEAQTNRMALRKTALESSRLTAPQTTVGDRIKIPVTDAGIYYVDAKDISSRMGIPLYGVYFMIGQGRLSLSNQGKQVAYLPAKNNAGFYFYGTGIDNIYTKENIYWIDKGKGTLMNIVRGKGPTPSPSSGERSFTETMHFEENLIPWEPLFKDPDADYWFWDQIFVSNYYSDPPKDFTFEVPGLATTQTTATLKVNLFGGSDMGILNDHHVKVYLNGEQIREDFWWSGQTPYTFTATSLINAGENTITVEGLLDQGISSNFILIDSFDVTYQRLYEANGDELFFRGDSIPQPLTVEGFTSPGIMVFDITNPLMPKLIAAATIGTTSPPDPASYTVSLNPASTQTPYLAVDGEGVLTASVSAVKSSNLSERKNTADYLIIAPDSLVSTAKLLADYRYKQGLKTMVVKLEDIMNEFNYGISSPEAIKKFLSTAYSRWRTAPRYVVLAGDGSIDYKNNMGFGGNLIPSKMVSTAFGLSISDNYLADINGDHMPEFALGRLPVLNSAELQTVINKIKTYESTGGNQVILLADTPDEGGDFISDSQEIAALLSSRYNINTIYLYDPDMIDSVRAAFFTAINNGAVFFNYVGHAAPTFLSYSWLLSTDDLSYSLQNAYKLPIMTAMTCIMGNFSDPYDDVLSEALLLYTNGGVAATWSPTGLSDDTLAKILNQEFYKAIVSGGKRALGDAVLQALSVYQIQGASPFMMDIYSILGDPALRIR